MKKVIYICDVCGREINFVDIHEIEVREIKYENEIDYMLSKDICTECLEDTEEKLRGLFNEKK